MGFISAASQVFVSTADRSSVRSPAVDVRDQAHFANPRGCTTVDCMRESSMRHLKSQSVTSSLVVLAERVERRILSIRGQKVMLSSDLAELYEVEPRVLV